MFPPVPDTLSFRLLSSFFKFHKAPWYRFPAPGLSRTETGILLGIERSQYSGKPLRISDLSHLMRVSSPTITQHINSLESLGLVDRTQAKEDKRAVNLSLTDQGKDILNKHREVIDKSFTGLTEYLGEGESEQLISLLAKATDFFIEKEKTFYNESNAERG